MKISSNKLSTRGLLVLVLLLAMEIVFVCVHAWLLEQTEAEAERQEETKEVIGKASELLQAMIDTGDGMHKYALQNNGKFKSKYETNRAKIPTLIAWLKAHEDEDPAQLKLLDKIEKNCLLGLQRLDEVKKMSDKEAMLIVAQFAMKMRGKLELQMTEIVADLNVFHNRERAKIERVSPQVMQRQRDSVKYLLVAGIAINIIIAVLLIYYFVGNITSRLAIVLDNAGRLRDRTMLRAPLAGDDEIALLDKSFHEMSHSLKGEESLLMASQEQLRAIVDQIPIGLMITASPDREEVIEYANPMLEKMLALESGALTDSPLSKHFSVPGPNNTGAPFSDTSDIEGVVRLTARKKDSAQLPVEFSVTDVSLSSILRRLATVVDISDKVEIEKMKAAFVSMISHELRTPLTSVSGFLQLLPMGAYGSFEAGAIEAASVAEAHVDRLITLINDLLDLEKLEAGKLEMSKTIVELEDVIDGAIDSASDLAEKSRVQVLFDGCKRQVVGDSGRLQQAFSKVLTCLLQLSRPGEIIKVVTRAAEGGIITIAIQTTQLYLSEDRLQTIFEPFQQLETSSGASSLGLGLPLARAIIAGHGGVCGANQEAGGGIALWLQLPL